MSRAQPIPAAPLATPAYWEYGDDDVFLPTVSNAEAETLFPGGWKTVKPYLRIVNQPH